MNFINFVIVSDKFCGVWYINIINVWEVNFWCCRSEVYFFCFGFVCYFDNLFRSGVMDDGVVD